MESVFAEFFLLPLLLSALSEFFARDSHASASVSASVAASIPAKCTEHVRDISSLDIDTGLSFWFKTGTFWEQVRLWLWHSGCGKAVEQVSRENTQEVVGSNPTGCWAFSLSISQ